MFSFPCFRFNFTLPHFPALTIMKSYQERICHIPMKRTKTLNANQLKLTAIIAMTIDHLTWTIAPGYSREWWVLLFHIIGRITAPIMWFFIAEGFHYTKNIRRYAGRLFLLAFLSHFAYNFCFGISFIPFQKSAFNQTSVVWSLAWGLVLLYVMQKNKTMKDWQKMLFVAFVCLITFPSDWSCVAAMAILFISANRGNFKKQIHWLMIWTFVYAAVYFFFIDKVYAFIQLGTCLSIPLLRIYNGERGKWKGMGKLFYAYYPVHLLVCGVIRVLFWGVGFVTATANF